MAQQRLGIIMNGVTGRMGMNQHLIRSIVAIRARAASRSATATGSCRTRSWSGAMPRSSSNWPRRTAITRWTTDLDAALKNKDDTLFFDAATTKLRAKLLRKAIAAGKDIYCEKPTAENLEDALDVARAANKAGIRHGVVQDKLFLPGLLKLKTADRCRLLRAHPRGARRVRLLGVRGRLAAGAAAVMELQEEGGRRHHPRHALPLALRARQPVRRGEERVLPRRHSHPEALGRERQALQGRRRRCRLCHLPARGRGRSRISTAPGARACAATISSPSMSTAPMARRSPACRNAGARRG